MEGRDCCVEGRVYCVEMVSCGLGGESTAEGKSLVGRTAEGKSLVTTRGSWFADRGRSLSASDTEAAVSCFLTYRRGPGV